MSKKISTSKTAKVAIITRTKDRPLLLPRALQSVANQTFKDFLWVIINDGGAPEPINALIKKARLPRPPIVIHNAKCIGMEAASNKGIRAVKSEYIVIHDDDDTWEPTFLVETVAFLDKHPRYGGVATGSVFVKEEIVGKKIKEISRKPFLSWVKGVYIIDMAQTNLFPPIAFLFRRSFYNRIGGFENELPVLGDWMFNLKLLMLADIGYIQKRLANYHARNQVSKRHITYGNTVTHQPDAHAEYDLMIRNRAMRTDLTNNEMGIGILLGLGHQHKLMWQSLGFNTNVLYELGQKFITSRKKRWAKPSV